MERVDQESQSSDGSNTPVSIERMNQIYDEETGGPRKGRHFAIGGALPRRALSSSSTSSGASLSSQLQMKTKLEEIKKENAELKAQAAAHAERQARIEGQLELVLRQQSSLQARLLSQQHTPHPYQPPVGASSQGGTPPPYPFPPYQYPPYPYPPYQYPPPASARPSSSSQQSPPQNVVQQAGHGQTEFGDASQPQSTNEFLDVLLNTYASPDPPNPL